MAIEQVSGTIQFLSEELLDAEKQLEEYVVNPRTVKAQDQDRRYFWLWASAT